MLFIPWRTIPSSILFYLLRPARLLRAYAPRNLRADLIAGLTVAVVLLPQGIAFALIAQLPPAVGLYTTMVGAIVGALWGSSNLNHTGPTSALSLLVLSALSAQATPGTTQFLVAAGLLAVLVGILQCAMGFARLGILVNFVSDAVIVGFSAGAGLQIAISEVRYLFGLRFASQSLLDTARQVVMRLPASHVPTLVLGLSTIGLILLIRQRWPRLPDTLLGLVVAAACLFLFQLDRAGVTVMGPLPSSLPPLVNLPLSNVALIARLSTGALAITAIGLIQTMAVARALAAETGERLDSNQEFVGQGLANLACGFFSGYPVSGSFSRSAVNKAAGARTPLAAVFSSLFVVIAMLTLAPLTAYLPRTALAAVLIVVAYGMIDRKKITRILRGARGDAAIMLVTLLGMLVLSVEFAVLTGILLSLGYYILKTSAPQVQAVVPDEQFKHLVHQPEKPQCPQLGILDIHGDLYFGAVSHVEQAMHAHRTKHSEQRFLLLRMQGVNLCDFSGIGLLESLVRSYREQGGDIFMTRVRTPVLKFMKIIGFYAYLGADHFLAPDQALEYLFYTVLDPAICIYESDVRVFAECQNLPRPDYPVVIHLSTERSREETPMITPQALWQQLRSPTPPQVVDVREPREFKQGHIPQAHLIPLSQLLTQTSPLPKDGLTVLVCRGGRRSLRAVHLLRRQGYQNVAVLQGGMRAWAADQLLEAVEG